MVAERARQLELEQSGLARNEGRTEAAAAAGVGKCIGCDRDLDSRDDPYSGSRGYTCLSCRAVYLLEPEAICQMWTLAERLKEFVERYKGKAPWDSEVDPISVPWWEYVPSHGR